MTRRIKVKSDKVKGGQKRTPQWVRIGALAACAALGNAEVPYAIGQSGNTPVSAAQLANAAQVYRFDIAPGTLQEVVPSFTKLTGITVTVRGDGALKNVVSPGVNGTFSADRALTLMLQGTGVFYRVSGPRAVILALEGASTTVDVVELPAIISPKYTEALRDTPQSISVIPKEVINQQGVTTLRDTLRNVPGISIAAGEGGAQGDNLTVRGFSARNDLFIDG